jgi:hypothetical protein
MTNEYDISLATPDDVSGIIALQEPNLRLEILKCPSSLGPKADFE